MKKGQMFIVTMVFLAGLIFTVQQLLFQYSFLDLSEPLRDLDANLLGSIRDMFSEGLAASPDCQSAVWAAQEIHTFLSAQTFRGMDLEFKYWQEGKWANAPYLECTNWDTEDPVLQLKLTVTSPTSYREVEYRF
jgi:hypothetical protein